MFFPEKHSALDNFSYPYGISGKYLFFESPKEDYMWIATISSLGFHDKDDFVPTYFWAVWNMQGFLLEKKCNGKEIR